ncbi:hypothetical protein LQ327_13820 [Actinomycetospora endophytica]|uniref:Protein kinase domain-containing protein n=1 Tax=Actinomycetospora endophytica TaxID=2291215 RepID=A0ABS8P8L5_9PSEU|nr:hypothetical protein [Actinomycetospora endophytica]MCD2194449.1 hypothetical protein [Actinomycetospora endophytica]
MTSQAPVEKTRTTPDGDALPRSGTESPHAVTESGPGGPAVDDVVVDEVVADDDPTGGLTIGAADAAVRGVDEVLGREVRLVTLPPASGEVLSERIEQVRHLARLHHPHLLEVYDVDGLAPDTESTLVLENVPGEPLPLVLREGPITEPALARMGAQLASALAHAHAHGVEHGAIGAASILVDRANADAWLVGLTASLSGPLPVVDPDAEDDGDGAARRRDTDVRALAATLAEVVEHAAAVEGGDDPEAVTRPTARDDDAPVSPLVAVLRGVDSPTPPSAALLSERLVRVARGGGRAGEGEPARLVPVVASWSESPPVPAVETTTALASGPAVRTRGAGGVTPFAVVGQSARRRARRAGVLGAATATLALASGLVIWAGESHVVRPEAQAEIGASAPSVPAPAVPHFPSFGGLYTENSWPGDSGSGSGSSGSDSGDGSGSRAEAVGVASRQAALPQARTSSTDPTTTSSHSEIPPRTGPTHPTDPTSLPPSSTRPTTQPPSTTTRPTTPSSTQPTTTQPPTTQPSTTQPSTTTQQSTTTQPTSTTVPAATGTTTTGTTTTGTTTTGTTTTGTGVVTPTTTTVPAAQVLAAGR